MSLNTIPMPMSRELTTDELMAIIDTMVGTRDQHSVAKALGLGQSSVSNFMRGTKISIRSSNKIAAAWNSFVETVPPPRIPASSMMKMTAPVLTLLVPWFASVTPVACTVKIR